MFYEFMTMMYKESFMVCSVGKKHDTWNNFLTGYKRECIKKALKRPQKVHMMHTIRVKRQKWEEKARNNPFSLHQAQPINKTYHGQRLILHIQSNPFQKASHKTIFNHLTRKFNILKPPLVSFHSKSPKKA